MRHATKRETRMVRDWWIGGVGMPTGPEVVLVKDDDDWGLGRDSSEQLMLISETTLRIAIDWCETTEYVPTCLIF